MTTIGQSERATQNRVIALFRDELGYRVRGDVLELWPAYEDDAVRIEFFGDEIDKITRIDPITLSMARRSHRVSMFRTP